MARNVKIKSDLTNESGFKAIKKNKCLYTATIMFLVYTILESIDCVVLSLMILKIIPNVNLNGLFINPIIQLILQNYTIFMLPFFLGFASWRMISTIGLYRNRLWGFWLGTGSLFVTIILDMWFLPIGAFEILSCIFILICLMIGYFGKQKIIWWTK